MIDTMTRKPDHRTEVEELRMDLVAERRENRRAWKAVAIANGHVLRLIEGGQDFAAHRWAEQIGYTASRRLRQTDPEGTAA